MVLTLSFSFETIYCLVRTNLQNVALHIWHNQTGREKEETAKEKKEYFHEYENKHTRKFDPEWAVDRPWLVDSISGLICSGLRL